jgi:GxxExxY protein
LDVLVENQILLELKSCDKVEPIHVAQTLTYLRLAGLRLGLILNFNVAMLRDGVVRVANKLEE